MAKDNTSASNIAGQRRRRNQRKSLDKIKAAQKSKAAIEALAAQQPELTQKLRESQAQAEVQKAAQELVSHAITKATDKVLQAQSIKTADLNNKKAEEQQVAVEQERKLKASQVQAEVQKAAQELVSHAITKATDKVLQAQSIKTADLNNAKLLSQARKHSIEQGLEETKGEIKASISRNSSESNINLENFREKATSLGEKAVSLGEKAVSLGEKAMNFGKESIKAGQEFGKTFRQETEDFLKRTQEFLKTILININNFNTKIIKSITDTASDLSKRAVDIGKKAYETLGHVAKEFKQNADHFARDTAVFLKRFGPYVQKKQSRNFDFSGSYRI